MTNLRVLKKENNTEYVWDLNKAKRLLTNYIESSPGKLSREKIYRELAPQCFVTTDAIKKWFSLKNGPSEYSQVEVIAKFFGIEPSKLLRDKNFDRKNEFMNDLFSTSDLFSQPDITKTISVIFKFRAMLDELTEKSKGKYIGFSEYTHENSSDYDIVFDDRDGKNFGRVVLSMCVDEAHHDIVCTYDDYVDEADYKVRVFEDEYEENYYYMTITTSDGLCIVIENGKWYI